MWVETSRMALGGSVRRVEVPWKGLVDAGRVLSLEGDGYRRAVEVVTVGTEDAFKQLASDLEIDMSREEVLEVLKVRQEYSKA